MIAWDKCGSYGKWHLRLKIPKVNISRGFSKRSWVKKLKVKEECSLKKGRNCPPGVLQRGKICAALQVFQELHQTWLIAAHVWLVAAAKAALQVFEELNQTWPIAAHDWLVATAKMALQVSEELHQTWPIAAHDWLVAADKVQLQV